MRFAISVTCSRLRQSSSAKYAPFTDGLPDMPWEQFDFLGNTSVKGAYLALLDWRKREQLSGIAKRMTYIELSADNSFYDAFTSALFLPHTDLHKFPSVAEALEGKQVDK